MSEIFEMKLKALLDKRGWTGCRLSILSGVEPGLIYGYMKGQHRPRRDTLDKLCEALGVPMDYFDEVRHEGD